MFSSHSFSPSLTNTSFLYSPVASVESSFVHTVTFYFYSIWTLPTETHNKRTNHKMTNIRANEIQQLQQVLTFKGRLWNRRTVRIFIEVAPDSLSTFIVKYQDWRLKHRFLELVISVFTLFSSDCKMNRIRFPGKGRWPFLRLKAKEHHVTLKRSQSAHPMSHPHLNAPQAPSNTQKSYFMSQTNPERYHKSGYTGYLPRSRDFYAAGLSTVSTSGRFE